MKIKLQQGVACLLLAISFSTAHAILPTTTGDGKPFPTLAPMLKQVNPAVVNISTCA